MEEIVLVVGAACGAAWIVATGLGAILPEESRVGRACRRFAADLRGVTSREYAQGKRAAEEPPREP